MRKLPLILLVVIALVAAAIIWGLASLDSIVKAAIEETGSAMTETSVRVESVSISLADSIASITGLTITNPRGFSQDSPAFTLGKIEAILAPKRTTSDVVVIKKLNILAPFITYEVGAQGSNVDAINKTVKKNSSGTSRNASKLQAEPRFIIDHLSITGGEIKLLTPSGKVASSDLPNINVKNIGSKSGGVTGSQIGEIIIRELKNKTVSTVAKGVMQEYLDKATDGLGGAVNKLFGRD